MLLDFAHVFARALNNVAHVGARARNNVAHEGAHVGARTRNSRTFYVANVPAYGIAVCLFVCLSVCQYVRRLSVAVRRLFVARGVSVNFEYMLQGEYILKSICWRECTVEAKEKTCGCRWQVGVAIRWDDALPRQELLWESWELVNIT
eukprot:scaffold99737_cov35-Attheya_sp.AAC.1